MALRAVFLFTNESFNLQASSCWAPSADRDSIFCLNVNFLSLKEMFFQRDKHLPGHTRGLPSWPLSRSYFAKSTALSKPFLIGAFSKPDPCKTSLRCSQTGQGLAALSYSTAVAGETLRGVYPTIT